MNKMMRNLLLTFCGTAFMLLVGCSTNIPNKSYFQLATSLPIQTPKTLKSTDRFLMIDSVDVVSFLNKSGIVLQTEDIKYVTATNNLWVSTLSQQLEERLVQDLSLLLPDYLVSSTSLTTPTLTVKLFIDGFHGSYNGDAIIKGRWIVTDNKNHIETKPFERHVPLAKNGYDALVKALSKGWQEEEQDFVYSITH
ncbi:membrane integrity-associated transporter subunit PqiC [Gilliamella sp. B2776]|uniref:ABC-type transport auxiliary lipoprotein family protein n=2 Tax=unclassified Gilliamella TaxID=2685620 RepID=UPI00226992F5|nr:MULTISPECIES: ABC-type transport auxiliary lipoprotein family protein [unclassified Gilliamella]MCX8664215.1 membrane integrity-associated transporter subunit PqiC [Gilliamella sp. B2887]MCX8648934.1 membrane integrity-associated transporter subunit PqiC [Gilliamella sp. B2779]MCX8653190.1 membrane integrity-associated transporter subunit PqiC [Gilliamella sp. B2737]MCX8690746.1 membrane integrity-associated transporter subunit PqiC [Gilliamella sp. B2776]MCX8701904.1 membrane integrity-ass